MFGRDINASPGLYFDPPFILGITLSLEFYILAETVFMSIKKHIEDLSNVFVIVFL